MEKTLKEILDEILDEIEQELDEATTTAGVDGYQTPFAFGAGRKKDKRKEKEVATQAGYTIAESVINEGNRFFNKWLLKYVDSGIGGDYKPGSPEYLWWMAEMFREALTDANFHSEAKKIKSIFSKAKQPKPRPSSLTGKMIQPKSGGPVSTRAGQEIANKAKWDGHDIIDGFSFVANMRIGGKFGDKFQPLKNESINEGLKYKDVKKGDVLYTSVDGVNKGRKTRDYYKVKILKPISNEPGVERFSAKQLDGLKKGKTVVVFLDTLSKKANESVNEAKKRFDVDFYKGNGDRQTSHEEIIRGDKFSDIVSQATKIAKSKGMNHVEFYYKDAFIGSIDKRNNYSFKKGRQFSKSPLSVNEAKQKRPVNRWLELKNDETMHPHKKMAMGLKELKYQLREVEKFFNWYNKIKTINELDSDKYWKRTNNHIYTIKEKLINIAKTIQEIEK